MQAKGFFDVFTRYNPADNKRKLLESATDAKFRYTKAPMRVEVELSFSKHCDAELLYEIEDECRSLYGAESFKIIPHFPPEEYNPSRFDEITYEAANCGAVTHGFFTYASYTDDKDTLRIELPFYDTGINFVKNANTEAILSNILFSRYGIKKKIIITQGRGADELEEVGELLEVLVLMVLGQLLVQLGVQEAKVVGVGEDLGLADGSLGLNDGGDAVAD